jgi:hypothetical protein
MIHLQITVKLFGLDDNMLHSAKASDIQGMTTLIGEQRPFLTAPSWKLSPENIQK